MKILLAFPSVFEANPVFKLAKRKARLGESVRVFDNIIATVCGIGCKKSQERLSTAVEKYLPDCIVLLGYCGACSQKVCSGDFVFSTTNDKFYQFLTSQGMKSVKFACEKKTASAQDKKLLAERGFDAVEMESDFFRAIAQERKIDFIHIRCVSDVQESSLPAELMDLTMDRTTGAINPMKMISLKRFMSKPSLLIDLIRFAKEIAPIQKFFGLECKRLAKEFNLWIK